MAIPRKFRLPRAEFRSGGYRAVKNPFFMVKIRPNGLAYDRAGIVAGLSVSKSAAQRNFFRRRTSEIIAEIFKNREINANPSIDVLIIVSPAAKAATRKEFNEKLWTALRSIIK